jgi:hypothetical protein
VNNRGKVLQVSRRALCPPRHMRDLETGVACNEPLSPRHAVGLLRYLALLLVRVSTSPLRAVLSLAGRSEDGSSPRAKQAPQVVLQDDRTCPRLRAPPPPPRRLTPPAVINARRAADQGSPVRQSLRSANRAAKPRSGSHKGGSQGSSSGGEQPSMSTPLTCDGGDCRSREGCGNGEAEHEGVSEGRSDGESKSSHKEWRTDPVGRQLGGMGRPLLTPAQGSVTSSSDEESEVEMHYSLGGGGCGDRDGRRRKDSRWRPVRAHRGGSTDSSDEGSGSESADDTDSSSAAGREGFEEAHSVEGSRSNGEESYGESGSEEEFGSDGSSEGGSIGAASCTDERSGESSGHTLQLPFL